MNEYVVFRHGWDAVNQDPARGLPEKMPVARVRVDNPDEACRRAADDVALSGNQFLSAEPADELAAREAEMNVRRSSVLDGEEQGTA